MGNRKRSRRAEEVEKTGSEIAKMSVSQLTLLNCNQIYFQSTRSRQHFMCQVCNVFLPNLQTCLKHIEQTSHMDNRQAGEVRHFLFNLPPICEVHRNKLTRTLEEVFATLEIDPAELARRQKFANILMESLRERFPDLEIVSFGSTWNGMALDTSDVNMSVRRKRIQWTRLNLPSAEEDKTEAQVVMEETGAEEGQDEKVAVMDTKANDCDRDGETGREQSGPGYLLSDIYMFLIGVVHSRPTIGTLGPASSRPVVVKMDENGEVYPLDVVQHVLIGDRDFYDISFQDHQAVVYRICTGCNNELSLNQLIRTYLGLNPQVRQLALLFRHFCRLSHLDLPMNGTFIPTVIPLLVIFYAQQYRSNPLLPNIHQLYRQYKDRVPKGAVTEVFVDGQDASFLSDAKVILDLWAASRASQKVSAIGDSVDAQAADETGLLRDEMTDLQQSVAPCEKDADRDPVVPVNLADLWLGLLRFYLFDFVKARFQVNIVNSEPTPKKGGTKGRSLFVADPFRPDHNLCSNILSDGFVYIWSQITAAYGYFGVPRLATNGTHLYVKVRIEDGSETQSSSGPAGEAGVESPGGPPLFRRSAESLGPGNLKSDIVLHLSPVIDEAQGYDENLVKAHSRLARVFYEMKEIKRIPCNTAVTLKKDTVAIKRLLQHMLTFTLDEVLDSTVVSGVVGRCLAVKRICPSRVADIELTLTEFEDILCELATTVWSSLFVTFIRLGKMTIPEDWLVENTVKPCRLILLTMVPRVLQARGVIVPESLLVPDTDEEADEDDDDNNGGSDNEVGEEDEVGAGEAHQAAAAAVVAAVDGESGETIGTPDEPMETQLERADLSGAGVACEPAVDGIEAERGEELEVDRDDGYPSTDENIDFSEVTADSRHDELGDKMETEEEGLMVEASGADKESNSDPSDRVIIAQAAQVEREATSPIPVASTPLKASPNSKKVKKSPKSKRNASTADGTKKAWRLRTDPSVLAEPPTWEMAIISRVASAQPVDVFASGYFNSDLVKDLQPDQLDFAFSGKGVFIYEEGGWMAFVLGLHHSDKSVQQSTMVAHLKPLEPICKACGQLGHRITTCNVTSDKSVSFTSWQKMSICAPHRPSDDHMAALSECLLELAKLHDPVEIQNRGSSIISFLLSVFSRFYPNVALDLFGSCANGFEMATSDMDVCVFFPRDSQEHATLQKARSASTLIVSFGRILSSRRLSSSIKSMRYILNAKVPILKAVLHSGYEVDISFSNYLAMVNTKMLRMYTTIEPRLRVLGIALKVIVKVFHIGNASIGGISSYGYILMLIHYLQQRDQLPVLQELYEGQRKPENFVGGWNAWYQDDIGKVVEMWERPQTRIPLSDLWLGFFRYYLFEFNRDRYVVTIKQKELLTRFVKMWNSLFAIEDPFKLEHNLTAALTRDALLYILEVFNAVLVHHTTFLLKDVSVEDWRRSLFQPNAFKNHERLQPPDRFKCTDCGSINHRSMDCPDRRSPRKPQHRHHHHKAGPPRCGGPHRLPFPSPRSSCTVATTTNTSIGHQSSNWSMAPIVPQFSRPTLRAAAAAATDGFSVPPPWNQPPPNFPVRPPRWPGSVAVRFQRPPATPPVHPPGVQWSQQQKNHYHRMAYQEHFPAATTNNQSAYTRSGNNHHHLNNQQHQHLHNQQGYSHRQPFSPPTKSKGSSPGITHHRQSVPPQMQNVQQYQQPPQYHSHSHDHHHHHNNNGGRGNIRGGGGRSAQDDHSRQYHEQSSFHNNCASNSHHQQRPHFQSAAPKGATEAAVEARGHRGGVGAGRPFPRLPRRGGSQRQVVLTEAELLVQRFHRLPGRFTTAAQP